MAVTTTGKEKEKLQQQQQQQYNGLQGVSQNTAQQAAQAQQPYQQGNAVQAAQQQLQQLQTSKPQGYASKYTPQLDNILQQIQGQKDFKYSFDGDELFKYYADLYAQDAKQASANAMGEAAALTGGYGNSYAQQVGTQAYQQQMLRLYDRGQDFYDRAYQRYRDRQGDLTNQYNILAAADAADYNRYRDDVGDWKDDLDYWQGRADTEDERAYQRWQEERDYWTGLAQVENADYRSEQERQEAIREYEQNFAENQRQYDTTMAENQRQYDQNYARQVLESDRAYDRGVLESDRDFAEGQRQYDANMAENQRQFDAQLAENIRQFNASLEWDKMSSDQKYAAEYAMSILQNGQMPSLELLKQAGLSEADAQKLMAQLKSGGSGGKGKTVYYSDDLMNMYKLNKDGTYTPVSDEELGSGTFYYDDTYQNGLGVAGRIASREGQLAQQEYLSGIPGLAQRAVGNMEQDVLNKLKGSVSTKIKKKNP